MRFTALAFGELEVVLVALIIGVSLGRAGYPWMLVCSIVACIGLTAARYSVYVELGQEQGLSDPKATLWRAIIGSWISVFMISHAVWLIVKSLLLWFNISRMH
ncbi:hypothetical protein GCM10007939_01170 [Amylibacter marinus]|uniref:Uncharacterized protein n=2 Tax=Amylibacter marinus TaxID=1475483 RepID=A0ABQ5VR62_9RHOB|nr:hypothetical protein GCM10007939_01170 [Amylibacter marinus]